VSKSGQDVKQDKKNKGLNISFFLGEEKTKILFQEHLQEIKNYLKSLGLLNKSFNHILHLLENFSNS
jgi:hypothetical protein